MRFFKTKHIFLKILLFPPSTIEWNSLDHNIRKVGSFSVLKNNILKFIRSTLNSVDNCENLREIKLITRQYVDLNHLLEHKFTNSNIVFGVH